MKRFFVLGALLLTTACLGPREDLSAFFLLSPAPPPTDQAPVPVMVGIGPVTIPGYLDRPQIVVRLSDNEVALSETDRWAEPLGENVVRTLEENLAGLLPGSSYVAYPWYESEAPDYAVALDVRRFEVDSGGAVVLEGTWRLSRGGSEVDARTVRITESASGPDRAASVAAQSRALAELSREIAGGVRAARGGR
ncbi:MAG: PqiC family protein [Gemmatimonadota bacterium]|jgi:hypothetical protein